jgi:thiamine biosynthesis lipoprotein
MGADRRRAGERPRSGTRIAQDHDGGHELGAARDHDDELGSADERDDDQQRDHEAVVSATAPLIEHRDTFPCFGSECTVIVSGDAGAVLGAKRRLLEWHDQFSRFNADSELSRLNRDPHATVPVSPMMGRIVAAALDGAERTGGLIDPTLIDQIEVAGYSGHFEGSGIGLATLLGLAPPRSRAGPRPDAPWRRIELDRREGAITRPAGVRLDPGGIAKGVFADELASILAVHDAFVVDCAGDIRLGGRDQTVRAVHVPSPFDGSTVHTFELVAGAAATSGIGRRSWTTASGRPAHHLLDPATGEPAFTGVVQATALAPTAAKAEILSKAAVLSGPELAPAWLEHGGLIVLDDRSVEIVGARG